MAWYLVKIMDFIPSSLSATILNTLFGGSKQNHGWLYSQMSKDENAAQQERKDLNI
jgi:hypothetical protein